MNTNSILLTVAALGFYVQQAQSNRRPTVQPVKNIVLVHGAWVDGSGWRPVYDILRKDGYHVTLVQEPLTSFPEDVAATRRVLGELDSSCVLVGHSYGGSIITEAGVDPHVAALVYIAAHMPDGGESEAADGKRFPSVVSTAGVIRKTPDGYTYLAPEMFPKFFAADLPLAQAQFNASAQIQTAASVFSGVITTPAWKTKPSWMMVAGADQIINPDLERWYAMRAHSHTVTVPGASHSVYGVASCQSCCHDRSCCTSPPQSKFESRHRHERCPRSSMVSADLKLPC